MKERIEEVFNLEWMKNFVEKNIDCTEWIEEEYGETRKVLLIETLVSGAHGGLYSWPGPGHVWSS